MNNIMKHIMPHQMTVHSNMFCAIMKNIVMCYLNSTLVAINNCSITTTLMNSHCLLISIATIVILMLYQQEHLICFHTRTSDDGMFLVMPLDKRVTLKEAIACEAILMPNNGLLCLSLRFIDNWLVVLYILLLLILT